MVLGVNGMPETEKNNVQLFPERITSKLLSYSPFRKKDFATKTRIKPDFIG